MRAGVTTDSKPADEPKVATERPAPVTAKATGRRVFEPPGKSSAGASKGRSVSRQGRPPEESAPKPAKKLSPDVIARQQETARQLALDKGIPQVHALRVVRGEVSLNVVLKNLMRKERATRLVEHDGLEPGLAGQVASGHLTRDRALELQKIRTFRKHRIDRDALKLAELDQVMVSVGCFDGTWATGKILEARTYEFDLLPLDGGDKQLVQKHDVKLVCPAEHVDALRAAESFMDTIREDGLGGTADRAERVRPKDARMLELIEAQELISCVLRDGSVYQGIIQSFGRWDMAVSIEGVGMATILFHSLHKSNTWID